MSQRPPALGDCPDCATTLPADQLIVRCERDGWPAVLAACPSCGEAVHPE